MGITRRREDCKDRMNLRTHKATEEYIAKRDAIPQFGDRKNVTSRFVAYERVTLQGL